MTKNEIDVECFAVAQPIRGSRIVAFYGDGSGANLFLRDAAGDYYSADGELIQGKDWFMDSGHCLYAYLPESFRLFFEDGVENAEAESPEQCGTCGDSDCDKPRECKTGDGV